MPCKNCKLKPVIKLTSTDIKLCRNCFVKYFERKVLKTIRTYDMIGKTKKIYILNDKFSNVNYYILNKLSEQRRGKFKVFKTRTKKGKTAISDNLDKTSSLVLANEFKNKFKKDLISVYKNKIKPLYFVNDEEVKLYAKIKKLKILKEKVSKKESKVLDFINDLEKKYPGTKNNIVKSYLELIKGLK